MKVLADFPIFDSPGTARANAKGVVEIDAVEIDALPPDGGWLNLPLKSEELKKLGFPYPMKVWCTRRLDEGDLFILLDGVVADGEGSAARVAEILKQEFGFDVDCYTPDPYMTDEENPELTPEQIAEMRPAAEVLGQDVVDALMRGRGRPKSAQTKTTGGPKRG